MLNGVKIRVLGSITLEVEEQQVHLTRSERQIIALLVAAGPDGRSSEQIADELWNNAPPKSWQSSFRSRISSINGKADGALISTGSSIRRINLPIDAVDAWRLLEEDQATDPEPSLLAGTPYAGVEVSDEIRLAIEQVHAGRHDLMTQFLEDGQQLSARDLNAIKQIVERSPFEQELAHLTAQLHFHNSDFQGVIKIVEIVEEALSEIQGAVPIEPLTQLKIDAQNGHSDANLTADTRTSSGPHCSSDLLALRSSELVGREELATQIVSLCRGASRGAVIGGIQGVGKTRLAAEAAIRLHEAGYDSVYVGANEQSFGILQPFVESFRGLREIANQFLGEGKFQPSEQYRYWKAIVNYLEAEYSNRSLCILIDDAQWLDRVSASLVTSLCRSDLSVNLKLIVCGRSLKEASWSTFKTELTSIGLEEIEVKPLAREHMPQFFGAEMAGQNSILLNRAADQIYELSNGIPAVAEWLGSHLDPKSLEVPKQSAQLTGYSSVIASLGPEARQLGGEASILGLDFMLGDLIELEDRDPETVLDHLEQLLKSGLVSERSLPSQYQFSHQLVREAFHDTLSSVKRMLLHEKAFGFVTDIHMRAHHAAQAVFRVGPPQAAEHLVASGRSHFRSGNYFGAAKALQMANEFDENALDHTDYVAMVESWARSGQRVHTFRTEGVAKALDNGKHAEALDIAVCGLPDTENLDGDRDWVRLIDSIPPETLAERDRLRRAVHLSRQQLLSGQVEPAEKLAAWAFESAVDPIDKVSAWLSLRHAQGWSVAGGTPLPPSYLDAPSVQPLKGRVLEVECIKSLSAGLCDETLDQAGDLLTHADQVDDPIGRWHALLLQSTAYVVKGQASEAAIASGRAQQTGVRSGNSNAVGASLAQGFYRAWLCGQTPQILPAIQTTSTDVKSNLLYRACMILAMNDVGRGSDAVDLLSTVMDDVVHSRFQRGVLAMLSRVIYRSRDDQLIELVKERIAPVADQHVLLGAGVADLGPGNFVLANVESDKSRKAELLRSAFSVADTNQSTLWQVLCRAHLAGTLGNGGEAQLRLKEATNLCSTPWLRQILDYQTSLANVDKAA